jgi:AhpD family alkylhydroperoxidase
MAEPTAETTGTGGTGPRLAPLAPREWPEGMRDALAALRPPNARHPFPSRSDDRPKGLNVLGTLARHPDLARAFHTLNGHLLFATTLEPREREVLVLRVAALRRCDYEWAQHVVLAADAGLGSDEVAAIAEGPGAAALSPFDAALVRAVDELVGDARIGDATWAALVERYDDQQMMDLVFTVGAYDVLAMAMCAFGIELDDDLGGNELLSQRDS